MSDRIAVMRAGRIVQIGTGRDLYERPADTFVARFLGESNLLAGTCRAPVRAARRRFGSRASTQPVEGRAGAGPRGRSARGSALIRPEHVRPMPAACRRAIVERVYLGEIVALRLRPRGGHWNSGGAASEPRRRPDDDVEIGWDRAAVSILPDAT